MNEFLDSTRQTVAWFKNRSDQDELIIRPKFQRNPVWLTPQKSLLIDSILRGYPIPELYLQQNIDDSGKTTWVVVDGQQRIRAFLEFIEGQYALTAQEVPSWPGMKFSDLSAEDRKKIYAYTFVIRTLPEMPEDQLRTMFTRLNKNNVALNKQELRHATYWGQFVTSINEISDRPFWVKSGLFAANDFRRMLDREYVSELAIGHMHGPQNKKETIDKWYAAYEEEFDSRRETEQTFDLVLGEVDRLLPNLRNTRWSKKSDFYTLFLVLAQNRRRLPLASPKAGDVAALLLEFAQPVDSFLRNEDPGAANFGPSVVSYSKGVQRAASDLNNRRMRISALEEALSQQWDAAN